MTAAHILAEAVMILMWLAVIVLAVLFIRHLAAERRESRRQRTRARLHATDAPFVWPEDNAL